MLKIVKYAVLSSGWFPIQDALRVLDRQVSESIALGWQPLGGVNSINTTVEHHIVANFQQAMVKYEGEGF